MVVLGRLTAPYGVKGWLHLHPFGDDPASWANMAHWWLSADDGAPQWTERQLGEVRQHGGGWVAKLEGVDSREDAEALVGWYFAAPREALPATPDGEYYWADLIGLRVVNVDGVDLGVIAALIATGANDVLQVMAGEQERLLPFIEQVVKGVDVAGRRVTVDWQADW